MTNSLTKTAYFDIPPEALWAHLTESEKLAKWFHRADADLVEGKDYALLCKDENGADKPLIWGIVLKADRPNELVYTFNIPPFDGVETIVTFQLTPVGPGTRLTLVHEGFDAMEGAPPLGLFMSLDTGWDEHLASLRGCANTG